MNYIYTRSNPPCAFCDRAKSLLRMYDISYEERDITVSEFHANEFKSQGFSQIPQVFLEGYYIGGYDKLKEYLI